MDSENQPAAASPDSLPSKMLQIGRQARQAARILACAMADRKSEAIHRAADSVNQRRSDILLANARDLQAARQQGRSIPMIDRLALDEARVDDLIRGLQTIAALPDPIGEVTAEWQRPNGLLIQRVRTPLGVVGVIYESRPNVTADAAGLCLKAGNAVILRCGSDSFHSSTAIHECLASALYDAGLPVTAVQLIPTRDRAAVGCLLTGLDGSVDVVVPRGGRSLVQRVQQEARVPVFSHLDGICHVFVEATADYTMTASIVLNSKMRRTGICGAAETLLIDQNWPTDHTIGLLGELHAAGCQIRGDAEICQLFPDCQPATGSDWDTEYLDAVISVRLVRNIEEAIEHIQRHGSQHTESIVTDDLAQADQFFQNLDSAIVLHNASTQFADGGEFGMGAEIGIATGKLHARGPVGVEQLTTYHYRVHGTGQTRT